MYLNFPGKTGQDKIPIFTFTKKKCLAHMESEKVISSHVHICGAIVDKIGVTTQSLKSGFESQLRLSDECRVSFCHTN